MATGPFFVGVFDLGQRVVTRGQVWPFRLLESVIGPVALLVNSRLATGPEARQLVDQDPDKANRLVVEAAEAGEKQVDKVLNQAGSVLGGAIDDIVGAVNPHAVVLGGFLGVLSLTCCPGCGSGWLTGWRCPRTATTEITEIMALEELAPRTVNGATLAARDACFYAPLVLTRPLI